MTALGVIVRLRPCACGDHSASGSGHKVMRATAGVVRFRSGHQRNWFATATGRSTLTPHPAVECRNERLAVQSACGVDGARCLFDHLLRRRRDLFDCDKARSRRSGARLQGAFAWNAAAPGIIFGLLVGFIAAQVWSDFERAKVAVANEASALRGVILLAASFPGEEEAHLRTLVSRHVEEAVGREWPAMADQRATLTLTPAALIEALQRTLALTPANDGQRTAQRELANLLEHALDARRQRIIISQSSVNSLKWAGLLLQALCTLIAIAMVHSDNRITCAIAVTLFATGIALSVLLIAAYNRPFTGDISVGSDLLVQVIPNGFTPVSGR